MSTVNASLLSIATLACWYSSACPAQSPPNVVQSDLEQNTAGGTGALMSLNGGSQNSAFGYGALDLNISGVQNAAFGYIAGYNNISGGGNAAFGADALADNQMGNLDTAVGAFTMSSSNGGNENTAVGSFALQSDQADANTAIGAFALNNNAAGSGNTAVGHDAMIDNQTGIQNTALGKNALYNSTGSSNNTIAGYSACWLCRFGGSNAGFGFKTLYNNKSGSNDIALGIQAGYNVTGSNNIDIGNQGVSGESGVMRLGAAGSQTSTYIAGISTTALTGAAVYVNSNGQLGVLASSERYKTQVTSMQANTEGLQKLRPVTFHLKTEPNGALQFGLIAEEVQKIFPDLVIRGDKGTIEGVRYDELTPILLKEVQILRAHQVEMEHQLSELKQQNAAMLASLTELASAHPLAAMR